ncbi:MAG: DJ-1/PfpI family protein [Methanobacteriota archaeon]
MTRILYHYILDTMADWETGYVLSELGSGRYFKDPTERYNLILCGHSLNPIKTMGGLHLTPDILVTDIRPGPDTLLILPGADTWLDPVQGQILEKVSQLLEADIVIAAICGATMGLAEAGLLNHRKHTSNNLQALTMFCPGYSGGSHYIDGSAVTDGNLITATGLAPVDFAKHIFIQLNVMREATLEAWYQLHITRKPEYYHSLVNSLK